MRALMRRADFLYDLPDELIARHPAPERSASRLLHLDGRTGEVVDRRFRELPGLLRAGDLLVFNDTRVVPARLHGYKHDSGGRVEVMLERLLGGPYALVQLRASKAPRAGSNIDFGDGRTVPLTAMLAALRRGEGTIQLGDGTRGMVPEDWLRRYARIAAFGEVEGDHVRYRPSQAALLALW